MTVILVYNQVWLLARFLSRLALAQSRWRQSPGATGGTNSDSLVGVAESYKSWYHASLLQLSFRLTISYLDLALL